MLLQMVRCQSCRGRVPFHCPLNPSLPIHSSADGPLGCVRILLAKRRTEHRGACLFEFEFLVSRHRCPKWGCSVIWVPWAAFSRNLHRPPRGCTNLRSHQQGSPLPPPRPHSFLVFLTTADLTGRRWSLAVVLICIFLVIKNGAACHVSVGRLCVFCGEELVRSSANF